MATDGCIFPGTVDPLDTEKLERDAAESLDGVKKLNLYVTGLTVA